MLNACLNHYATYLRAGVISVPVTSVSPAPIEYMKHSRYNTKVTSHPFLYHSDSQRREIWLLGEDLEIFRNILGCCHQ